MVNFKYLFIGAIALILGGCGGEDRGAPLQSDAVVITALQITPKTGRIPVGLEMQLAAFAQMSNDQVIDVTTNPTVTWRSSDAQVMTVDNKGLVTAINVGHAIITASGTNEHNQYFEATASIEVTDAVVTGLQVTPPTIDIAAGLTTNYIATAILSDNSTLDVTRLTGLTWTSSDETIAIISNASGIKGQAKGIAPGIVTIMASGSVNGNVFSATAKLTINNKVITGLRIDPKSGETPVGLDYAFTASAIFSDGSTRDVTKESALTWSSEDIEVATVGSSDDRQGVATGVRTGTAVIRASGIVQGETFTDTATLTVTDAVVTRLAVTPTPVSLTEGLSTSLTATAFMSDGTTKDVTDHGLLSWYSLDTSIATVSNAADSKGSVTAISVGEVIIRASGMVNNQSFNADAILTVNNAVIIGLEITPESGSVAHGNNFQFTAKAILNNGQQVDLTDEPTLSWSSDNPNIASIITGQLTLNGIAAGVNPGTVAIRAHVLVGNIPFDDSAELTVTDAEITALRVTPSDIQIPKTVTQNFYVQATMSDGTSGVDVTNSPEINWSSDNRTIATVVSGQITNNGLVTGENIGSANITATVVKNNSISDSARVNVVNTSLSQIFGKRHDGDQTKNYLLGQRNEIFFKCGAIVDGIGTPELGITGGPGGTQITASGVNVSSVEVSWGVYSHAPGNGNQVTLSQIILKYSDGTTDVTCGNKEGMPGSDVSNVTTGTWNVPEGEKFYGFSIYAATYSHELRVASIAQ
ncbi:MAG: Ig-like domain-containing protein [Plesiomonas sp.]|uniref:Ig-like domain-containing protein n=1 Tax=Plesiomonas sp. TaxID=2486279 RepID=UPI003F3E8EA9